MWCIGDWWAFGEVRYGQRKELIIRDDWKGPDYQTCKNAASICRAFEKSRRRDFLTFTHYAEVVSLPPDEADALLSWAAETIPTTGKPRPTRELRAEVGKRRNAAASVSSAIGSCVP
jgi:hypothetical protein